jgi:hypothetical protein
LSNVHAGNFAPLAEQILWHCITGGRMWLSLTDGFLSISCLAQEHFPNFL